MYTIKVIVLKKKNGLKLEVILEVNNGSRIYYTWTIFTNYKCL